MGQRAIALGRNFSGDGAIIMEEVEMYGEDGGMDERRLKDLEARTNTLADLIEMLAKERHVRLGHAKPFGEFGDRRGPPDARCDDPVCREAFYAANVERL